MLTETAAPSPFNYLYISALAYAVYLNRHKNLILPAGHAQFQVLQK